MSETSGLPAWIGAGAARVAVTITGPDGSVQEFTAEGPEKTEVELGRLPSFALEHWKWAVTRGEQRFQPPERQKLTVVITPDERRPLAMTVQLASRPDAMRWPAVAEDPVVAFAAARLDEDERTAREGLEHDGRVAVSEIEVRRSLPEKPTQEAWNALLGRYLRIDSWFIDGQSMTLQVEGALAPWWGPGAAALGPAALRRALLDSLDAVIGILEAAGARWERHPQFFIDGEVQHRMDGGQEFYQVEGHVTLDLLVL